MCVRSGSSTVRGEVFQFCFQLESSCAVIEQCDERAKDSSIHMKVKENSNR